MTDSQQLDRKTIQDFGEQWQRYTDNSGFYGSTDLFRDAFPMIPFEEIRGKKVADIGSGTGRIISMLLVAGAGHVVALEPSESFAILEERFKDQSEKVSLLNISGEKLPPLGDLDFIFSYGVFHHIPDPAPVVLACLRALKPGGKVAIWLYGREGNESILFFLEILRKLTAILPHFLLATFVRLISVPLTLYGYLAAAIGLPLGKYFSEVFLKLSADKKRLVIYDQLNPAYAKYYSRDEAEALLKDQGFESVAVYHRHGYSWTVTGVRPST